jgi:hypothetical protein
LKKIKKKKKDKMLAAIKNKDKSPNQKKCVSLQIGIFIKQ